MKIVVKLPVSKYSPTTELAGAIAGSAWFLKAREEIDAVDSGFCVVDFDGIRLATVSWLREGLIALQKYTVAMRPQIVLAVTHLEPVVREELEVALQATSNVMLSVEDAVNDDIRAVSVLGRLDPALDETLQVVRDKAEFDASFVSENLKSVGLSAANNRLAALEARGLLKSERRGRSRFYRPLVELMTYGN